MDVGHGGKRDMAAGSGSPGENYRVNSGLLFMPWRIPPLIGREPVQYGGKAYACPIAAGDFKWAYAAAFTGASANSIISDAAFSKINGFW